MHACLCACGLLHCNWGMAELLTTSKAQIQIPVGCKCLATFRCILLVGTYESAVCVRIEYESNRALRFEFESAVYTA